MNKIFLFAKHAKSGEDCNKFSGSVSYETLVGGTTTVGGDYKQTRCLSKDRAGYRFCKTMRSSYENLVDRLLQTLLVFKKVCKSRRKCLIGSINLIRRSLEFFAFAKNRDDSFFVASPRYSLKKIATSEPVALPRNDAPLLATSAFRLLAMTMPTLSLAALLSIGITSESWAYTCEFKESGTSNSYAGVKTYSLSVTGDAGGSTFTGCTSSNSINYPYGRDGWSYARSWISSVSLDNNITSIGSNAFPSANHLTSISMPAVTSVGEKAFHGVESLTSIDMPNVTSIGRLAFDRAYGLQSVNMPKVEEIGQHAFGSTSKLKSITISDAADTMGRSSFWTESTITDINCIEDTSTESTCEQVKNLMRLNAARFSDDSFHTITSPTPNCTGYSQGICSTCNSGYSIIEGSCARECNETEYRQGSSCVSRSVGCSEGYMLENITCISQSVGCSSGYLNKDDTVCIEPAACGGEYIADEANGVCKKMPGCVDFADGACGGCESGYYKKETGCVAASDGCGEGYLKKGTSCISAAQGCGESFKLNDGECDRIRYTPAEAAQYLKDTDNEIIMTFKVNR